MTPEMFAKICEWDAKCTAPEEVMFGTTIDRRRLIEYVHELQAKLVKVDGQYASYREAAGASLGAMAELDERIKDLEGVVERKSALIHLLVEKLDEHTKAAKGV